MRSMAGVVDISEGGDVDGGFGSEERREERARGENDTLGLRF